MPRIADVRGALQQSQERRSLIKAPSASLRMTEEGCLLAHGECYKLEPTALASFAHLLGIPAPYFCSRAPDAQAWLFNRELHDSLASRKLPPVVALVVDGDTVKAVCKAHLALVPADAVFTGVLSKAPRRPTDGAEAIEVHEGWMPGHAAIALLLPSAGLECQAGDAVVPGVEISHSPDGQAGAQVSTLLLRAVCGNGVLVWPRADGRRLRIRTPRSDSKHALRTFRKQVKRVAAVAWRDLDALLGALKQLLCVPVGNLAEAVDCVARVARLTLRGKARCEILRALEADECGPGYTLYHVLNACSWVGTHAVERPLAWRRRLLFACGEILRRQTEGRLTASERPGPDERRSMP